MVELYNSSNPRAQLIREYKLTPSALYKYNSTSSFNINNNCIEKEKELIKLCKKIQRLRIENDILKQIVLIMERK